MRETMREMMSDVRHTALKPRLIANNTVEYHKEDGARIIRLHHTDILTFQTDNKIVLNTSGWQTVTTKDRMNAHLPWPDYKIAATKGQWYIYQGGWEGKKIAFYDGVILPDAFENTTKSDKTEKKTNHGYGEK